jgi:hypothetical protein
MQENSSELRVPRNTNESVLLKQSIYNRPVDVVVAPACEVLHVFVPANQDVGWREELGDHAVALM